MTKYINMGAKESPLWVDEQTLASHHLSTSQWLGFASGVKKIFKEIHCERREERPPQQHDLLVDPDCVESLPQPMLQKLADDMPKIIYSCKK